MAGREIKERIILDVDQFGLPRRNVPRDRLRSQACEVVDIGVTREAAIDYPQVGAPLAESVSRGDYDRSIEVCGSCGDIAIVANQVPWVRAVRVTGPSSAEKAITSDGATITNLGSPIAAPSVAHMLVDIRMKSDSQGGRSASKDAKMEALDEKYRKESA